MKDVYVRAKNEAGYTASIYLEMLHRPGVLKRLGGRCILIRL